MLIIPGDKKVNPKKAAKTLGVNIIQIIPFDKAEEKSGYPPGGTPSIDYETKMRVLVDKLLLNSETVHCGGGSKDKLLELTIEDIIR